MAGVSTLLPGMQFTRYAIALARGGESIGDARAYAEQTWGSTSIPAMILRSAVDPGSMLNPTWAGSLSEYRVAAQEFIAALRPMTILGKLTNYRRVPLNVKVPRATAGSSVGWVGQSSPMIASSLAFDTVTLDTLKLAGMIVVTAELLKFATPAAEGLVRADLLAACAYLADRSLVDPTFAGEDNVSPASIASDAPSMSASGTTAAALRADLRNLFLLIADDVNLQAPALITDRKTAIALALMDTELTRDVTVNGGMLAGVPLITSASMPAFSTGDSPAANTGNIVLVDAAELLIADENTITIDLARHATVQMSDTPDSPQTANTVLVNLWQRNLVAWRVVRPINWQLRRPNAVAVLTNANYSG